MDSPRGIVQRLDQHLHRTGMLPRGGRVMVAVSGGADSVALLRLLAAVNGSDYWGWTLVVGHVDHGIRGRASGEDARFVRKLAREVGVGFVGKKLKLGARASEGAARAGRLRALREMARRKKCAVVVMGHHADDQAETVLMRMMRGAGLEGLSGMGAVAEVEGMRIVRPLLGFRRRELREYLEGMGQEWCEDETNVTAAYLRNRVRGEVMPVVEGICGSAVEAMGRAAMVLAAAARFVEERVDAVFGEVIIQRKQRAFLLRRAGLQEMDPFLCAELVRRLVREVGGTTELADFERVQEAVRMIQAKAGGKTIQMGAGVQIRAGGGVVSVERRK